MAAAVLFRARARLAKRVVAERRLGGATALDEPSSPAHLPSAVQSEREHADLVARMSREERIAEGMKLLHQRASFIEVGMVLMEDDGNCQFRALAYELHGSQQHHLAVRATVLAHLRARADEYSFYVGDEGEWRAYLSKMALDRTWGDELTLRAASEAYGCAVHVVTTETANWLLHYGDGAADHVPGRRDVFLAYVSPIHYNVVGPLATAEYVRRRHAARVLQARQRRRSSVRNGPVFLA